MGWVGTILAFPRPPYLLQQWAELVAENPCFRNPAVRPRVQVQHDFDIKGVVGIKTPACRPR